MSMKSSIFSFSPKRFDCQDLSTNRICRSIASESAYQTLAQCYAQNDSRTAQELIKKEQEIKRFT